MSNHLPKGWYAILDEKEIKKKNHPYALERFGLNLVLWKNNHGLVRVMLDKCPHRSAKLSGGKIVNDEITCPYHAFKFCAKGSCTYAPEFEKSIPGLNVKTFAVIQKFNMIWVYYGDGEPEEFVRPSLETIDQTFNGKYSFIAKNWHAHITRCIENQLDYTHVFTVHKTTIGRGFKIPQNSRFIINEPNISIFQTESDEKEGLEYLYPNAWILHISRKMKLLVFFVPISMSCTRIYVRTYSSMGNIWLLGYLFNKVLNISNRVILRQDQRVVESQECISSHLCQDELLMKHDAGIRAFRKMWADKLNDSHTPHS